MIMLRLLFDDSGATAAEYALILGIVGTAIAISAIFLGQAISTAVSDAAVCIETAGGTCPR